MKLSPVLQKATLRFEAAPQGATAMLRFSGEEFFFDGHFPNDPIVPAVVQIDISLHLAARALGRALALREVTRAVFKRPVGPGQDLEFDLAWHTAEAGVTRLKCDVRCAGQSVAELSLRAA